MKIVFFGTSPWSRFYLEVLQKGGWEIVGLDSEPEVGVMAYYGKILSKETLQIPKKGILNVHHSLLPRWRGPAPVQYAILAGDKKTGVSIILTSQKVDAGDILASREAPILPGDTYLTLEEKLIALGIKLLLETLPLYLEGKIKPEKQNEVEATYSKKIKTEDGKINWMRPAEEIWRQIRALNPEPGTFTFLPAQAGWDKKRLIILDSQIIGREGREPDFQFGEVIKYNNSFVIGAKGGFIKPLKIKLEGKKETTPESFLQGHPKVLHAILT